MTVYSILLSPFTNSERDRQRHMGESLIAFYGNIYVNNLFFTVDYIIMILYQHPNRLFVYT